MHLCAHAHSTPELVDAMRRMFPMAPTRATTFGRTITEGGVVYIRDIREDPEYSPTLAEAHGSRCGVGVPMLRDDQAIGAIVVGGREPQKFRAAQIELLKTFADQAVIAIENVRLFKELEARNRDLTAALEQQTATSEILRVISSSPTDLQPVLAAVAENAARVCGAIDAQIYRVEGESLRWVASHGPIPPLTGLRPINREWVTGRAVVDRCSVHVHDLAAESVTEYPIGKADQAQTGHRTTLATPLLREGLPLGAIVIRRLEVIPFSDKQVRLLETFADQAVIAIENVRLFKELEMRNAELTTALERQTATSEILRVISGAQQDAQAVFDTIVQSAVRLCRATTAAVFRVENGVVYHPANYGGDPEALAAARARYPRPVDIQTMPGMIVLARSVVQIPDSEEVGLPDHVRQVGRILGFRSVVGVPMLREVEAVGALLVTRREPGRFSDSEVELLETFSDQAVIAIENVRLFKELEARNRDLTATSEVLQVISRSPTDVQPVFDTIATNALRLCAASNCAVFRFDGELIHVAALQNVNPEGTESVRAAYPGPASRGNATARAILTRDVVDIRDVRGDPEYQLQEMAAAVGFRSVLAVPMLREGDPIGAISVTGSGVAAFSDKQVALLKTFADQAVIAIENVRLFTELQQKNDALTQAHAQVTEALEQQTVTAEILRVISSSPTDIEPVFEAIAESSVRLCKADYGSANRLEGDMIYLVAQRGQSAQWLAAARRLFPHPLTRDLIAGGAMLDREVVHLEDMQSDMRFPTSRGLASTMGYRTALSVPMLLDNAPLGAIVVFRQEGRPFSEAEIGLLRTFADQAVIAIENVRLFTELQARTQQLTRSVGQLTALGEVARAVSSTLDLETVLNTIVSRAIQLSETDGGSVYEYDEATEEFSLRASRHLPEAYVEQVRDARPRKGEGAVGRVAQTREPVQIADISDPAVYESRVRNMLLQIGLRALLAVPLIAEDQLVGALIVMRKRSGTFASEEVALLQTFATQSALAIQNARLFREIADKSRQLEVASQHKSEFLANMSHELRTPLNAIIGFSEVLTDRMFGELNEKQEEYLKDIYASGTHLLSLINDILDLSKIEAGRMELELTEFDLPTALDNALMLVRERAQRRSLTLHKDVDAEIGQVRADERKIRQVVLNLLSNAIKFTPEGGRIEVAAVPKDGLVEVSVSDTGVGIAREDQEKVFEEFRQVGTADKKAEGTGLGLTLCRKFIELHGGRIWVKSQLGGGSTFTFTIPVRRGE
jgi:GAF domain-containing protein/anti-sigma regulatory factor (Ser/Thr protein kinase)